ncbi:MAG: protease, partial [Bacteroidetes bacterium]|nr:protease [Candidatus Cryptobacteroides merdigallinarum]
GVVIGNDGTLYVTTGDINWTGDGGRVTAVNPDGSVKWEAVADGDISGCAAVDNEGYVYYNDCNIGKLVKLSPEDGSRVSEIVLAPDGMRSSPTISCDGTIYCTGMKDGHPTLFAVKGSATGHGTSWSQFGGNPQKSCVR